LNLGTGVVTVSNSLTVSVTNTLVVGGSINGGTLTLTLNGTGTLELDGNNTFGTVSTAIPLLLFGNDYAAGNNTAILNCALPGAAFASSSSATRTIHNILGANGGNGWTFSGTGNLIFDGGVTSYNFPKGVTVNNPVTTWNFALPNGAASTTKYGAGTLVLSGANQNTGGNIVSAGTLALANTNALGTGPLTMNGGNLDCLTANLTNLNNNAQTWNANFTFRGSQSLDLGNGAVTMASSIAITVTNTLTVEGAISDGGSGYSLTSAGPGTLVLSGANTYTGNTTIQGGTLELAQNTPTLANGSTVAIASGAHLKLDDGIVTNVVTTLVLSGATNAPGVYSSANSSGYITGLGYLQVLTGPAGPTGPARLTNSVSGSTLGLSWPAGQGWRLQMQTNSLSTGLGTNWIYITDGSINSTNITIDTAKPTAFYRLVYP
jgi:autotransporter-associated beta strand protein